MHNSWAEVDSRIFRAKAGGDARLLAERYGYRPETVDRYIDMLGPLEARELLEANEEPMTPSLRCNSFKVDCGVLRDRLESKGFILEEIPFTGHGYYVFEAPHSIGSTHEYLKGYYYVQGPASMTVVELLDPAPGEVVLDAAAAPGGKSTQIQQLTGDSSLLIAVDKSRRRLRALRSHMQRMGFSNYVSLLADSRRLPPRLAADRVLLDAPSTGEGIIRRDPARKTSRGIEDLAQIHRLQYEMLASIVDHARRGGVVVYSSCSLGPEEGELVIHKLVSERGDVSVDYPGATVGSPALESFRGVEFDKSVRRCVRFWPHIHGTEGFFMCRLVVG